MTGKVNAFARFGVSLKNVRSSWSGVSPEGETVVLALWKHLINYRTTPISYDVFNLSNFDEWKDRDGNQERSRHLRWALDHCGGKFRVVIATAKDQGASIHDDADYHAHQRLLMQITDEADFNEATGEFRAVNVGS